MKIEHVIDAIKKLTGREVTKSPMYDKVSEWRSWLDGNVDGFHEYSAMTDLVNKKYTKIKRHKTDMLKRGAEDWASLLLNEKTRIELDDKASEKWLQGEDGRGGVLGENAFRRNANELITTSRWSGTAAFEVYIENMAVVEESRQLNAGTGIGINFLAADQIIPISHRNGILKEVAFASSRQQGDKVLTDVTMHTLESGQYILTTFTINDEGNLYTEPVTIRTGSPVPWFSVIRKSGYNRHDTGSTFGASIIDGNEDVLKGLDAAFDNFIVDFILGRKMVFMNSSMFNEGVDGSRIAPQMAGASLFMNIGDSQKDGKFIEEYNPTLRVQENADGIQKMLDLFSFKVGLGEGFYKLDDSGVIKTATEFTGSKQTLVKNVAKEMISVSEALVQIVEGILWIGASVLHVPGVKADAKVSVLADDSYITDEYTERKMWQEEIAQGLRSPVEYRVRFFGESEEDAAKQIAFIKDTEPGVADLLGSQEPATV
ncbi:MAG: hypothetical protein VB108_01190 [Anaerolineaceae bacterium]|nr:hypothetical protein [Anaerolineaceae bacterium]